MDKCFVLFVLYFLAIPLFSQVDWGGVGTKYRYDRETELGTETVYSILNMTVDRDTVIDGKLCQVLKEEKNKITQ